jgi:thymidylate synthase (FAD)
MSAASPPDAPASPPAPPAAPAAPAAAPAETADKDLVDALPPRELREVMIGQHGFVRLVDVMPRLVAPGGLGPEAAIVQAARVSYGAGTKTVRTDEGLLRYLLRCEHMTPFEMVELKFCVRAPIFTARQWMRHRAGSFNEESARYSKVDTDFFVPDPASVLAQSTTNRQGTGAPLQPEIVDSFLAGAAAAYDGDRRAYDAALEAGVARELARMVLPEGRYTTFYWKVNLRNLFGFLELRMDDAAQEDIRNYAGAIHRILKAYCPVAVRAFDDYRRNAVTLSALEIRALRTGELPAEASARERAEWDQKKARLSLQ